MSEQRCPAGDGCAGVTSEGPALTSRPLCHRCVNQIEEQLRQLPIYREVLIKYFKAKSIVPQSGGAKVSGGNNEGSTPINVHVLDLITELDAAVDDVHGTPIVDLINQDGGVPTALRVRKVWAKVEHQVGFTRTWHRRMASCPKCTLQTLGSFSGSDIVICSSCGGQMSRDEYDRVCLIRGA